MTRLYIAFLMTASLVLPAFGASEKSPEDFPGVSAVVPRAAEVVESAGPVQADIAALTESSLLREEMKAARNSQEALEARTRALGDPTTWNVDRLLEMRGRASEQRNYLKRLMDDLSERLSRMEAVRRAWEERRSFWRNWEQALGKSLPSIPEEAFQRAREAVDGVLELVEAGFGPMLDLQNEITDLQVRNLERLNQVEAILNSLRGNTFSRTAYPLASLKYISQFGPGLWESVESGVAAVQLIRKDFLRDSGWIITLQVVLALVTGIIFSRQRKNPNITREWLFLLAHPWATGIFVSVSTLSFLYPIPPALWRLLLWALAAGSASILISGLLKNPRKKFMVCLLAGLFILSLSLQIISLPQPLYRLYLTVLCLLGIPLFLVISSRNIRQRGSSDGFSLALRIGAAVLFASFAAQFAGYANLASRLIESSVETVFLGLFATMVIRLGRGAIEFVLTRKILQEKDFFRRYGSQLESRLERIFEIFTMGYAALYLLVVWRIFDSVAEAWKFLLESGFPWGETQVSLHMVLMIILVLYASIQISWGIRALLESEFFARQDLDRGVRDSVKKLLHYALILVGFLLALSMAGLRLENFAVLAGALGIGIGFGLQNIINNFVSGLILLFERPIKIGDLIVMDEEWGTVKKLGLRSTIVETLDRAEIIVPNSDLISEKVTNWTLSTKIARVVVKVGVAYGSDVKKVLEILQEAAQSNKDVLESPAPSALFMEFGESSLDFELRAWIAEVDRRLIVRSDLGQFIDARFRKEGVEIPFPQRDLHFRTIEKNLLQALSGRKEEGPGERSRGT